jgi:pSer/pThr/pTyr-binding forkhead associated (FHA) protein
MIHCYTLKGPEAGKDYEFKSDTIYIGRSPENDMQIRDPLVSRKHLKVSLKDNKYRIVDLQSANGTFIGNKKIVPNTEVDIEAGLPIVIGVSTISFGKPCADEVLPQQDSTIQPIGRPHADEESADQRLMQYKNNMNLIFKILDLLKESLMLDELLDKIVTYILNLLIRIDRVFIVLIDTVTMDTSKVISKSRNSTLNEYIEYNRDIVDEVIRSKKAVIISDQYSKYDMESSKTSELPKSGSTICMPLINKSQIRGVIYLDSIGKTNGFRLDDLELLDAIGSIIALILDDSLRS